MADSIADIIPFKNHVKSNEKITCMLLWKSRTAQLHRSKSSNGQYQFWAHNVRTKISHRRTNHLIRMKPNKLSSETAVPSRRKGRGQHRTLHVCEHGCDICCKWSTPNLRQGEKTKTITVVRHWWGRKFYPVNPV